MRVFFYNGRTNNLQSVDTYKLTSSHAIATPRVYGYSTGGPENDVIFYSEELDSLVLYKAAEAYGSLSVNNFLMVHSISSSACAVFDASTAQIYEKNITLSSNSIGDSLIFGRNGDMELTAYSGITKNWVTKQTDQQLYGFDVGDVIGLGYSMSFAKYWGYSAHNDSFYELVPGGSFAGPWSFAGGNTAIVIRSDRIYAFSPGSVTAVGEDSNNPVGKFSLSQNYPNPFNPTTKIGFVIPNVETGHAPSLQAKLVVFDIIGNRVSTLVNEIKQPGTYEVEFDASNLSSGVYFYQLKAGDYTSVKKMLLLK